MSQIFFTYPKPEKPLPYKSVNPRSLHPLSPPTQNGSKAPPALPLEAARRASGDSTTCIIPGYVLSTHMFQAAGPRTKCKTGPTPQFPMSSTTRKQDIAALGAALEDARDLSKEPIYEDGWPGEPLWIVVNRFVSQKALRRQRNGKNERSLTLNFMHANGTHKETWEESLKAMVQRYSAIQDTVDEIWLLDAVNEGDSALVNEGYLGNIFNWQDHARDLQQFLLYYMPDKVEAALPVHLVPLSKQVCESRRARGFDHRQLIAVGHSFGGAATIRAAIETPAPFSDVILVDPVIHSPANYDGVMAAFIPSAATMSRRTEWSSRKEALESLQKSPFFSKWDPKVLQAYVDYGIAENPALGTVHLKTSGYQEAAVFAERRIPMEIWELLPKLEDRVKLHWIMNGKEIPINRADSDKMPNSVWQREYTVWRREVNTSHVRIRDSGHLVAQIKPHDLGTELGSYVLGRSSARRIVSARL